MAGKGAEPDEEDEEGAEAAPQPKKGLLANKKLLIIAAAGLIALLGSGAAAYFFLFAPKPATHLAKAKEAPLPLVPPKVAFYNVPDIVVNIQSQNGNPTYLKLEVTLELKNAKEEQGVKVLMPRIVDQFQSYLRELRVADLQGSASVMRVKEELLRRINVAVAPYRVQDVLLKEMIVQ
ncbi:MAG: flagellar basal body-associated FliL family protein [Rhizomicrobium sp.]